MKRTAWPPCAVTVLRRGAAVAAALLAVLSAATVPATAAETPTRDGIYEELGVADQPVDYVVLVDTSGSMAADGRYGTVRSTLGVFLDGLSDTDHVALITFDDRPDVRYIGSAGNPGKIVSSLPKAPNPTGGTDIGSALDRALRELERADAGDIASVVMLTDGKHEPPRGSDYPKASGASWDDLRERADALGKRTELAGYALPLGSGATGADLLGDVVENSLVLRPESIEDLSGYLRRAGDNTRARSAALLLAEDNGKGVTASWTGTGARDLTDGSATASVTFRSATRHVPLTVSDMRVSVDGVPLRVTGVPKQLTLKPGESREYAVRLDGGPQAGGLPYRRTEDGGATLRVSGQVTSPWQRALAPDVDLKVPDRVGVTGDALAVRAEVGSVYFLPAVCAALAAVLAAGSLWWLHVNRPRLRGVLTAVPVFVEAIPERIALSGRRVNFSLREGGRGTVHGRRRRTPEGSRVDLLIRYTPAGASGRPNEVTCEPGAHVVVGGLSFTYLPPESAAGSGSGAQAVAPGTGRP
ncbi:VWA domain-containing protein [Streptomyces spinoverrucosus]|uniref:vWA domain-containing protein n=1 Tax=Streptomyces spinoverrucosus TaxID=284043 RepID=UPI0018C4119D|nr:vWA domain-containing protein [Streptomyces spinoverrucosus]MBG0851824.1 VWA domain-containing protein [Streptomyces spinoverrucosus]